ncbi:acyl-CoA thioesterase [Kordiimonas pumila]|uniref:Acyl-CoA thioesterase n=1 Tax=Kordiimonas pumila TaxID=2161677 RepID=A0ABV7D4Z6_9PROT|nr:acyl-CoA thioesterase [Kordiimonas pumila]
MTDSAAYTGITRLVDIIFPGDANHHGTMFGGVGLAQMDKAAFIAAARYARANFVTASCEHIDFEAPAYVGEIADVNAHVTRVGQRSLTVTVELIAEALLTGERRLCSRGQFNMVAVGAEFNKGGGILPPLPAKTTIDTLETQAMVDIVFPEQTSHYGSLYGGNALAAMGKAASITATRHCRKAVVMASSQRADFTSQVQKGEIIILYSHVTSTGNSSMAVAVELWAESLFSHNRRHCGQANFIMVAVNKDHKPVSALD